ncbi:MAG: TIGR03905 family TSCPD domain-containing protein [Kiritimatiellae bacterium]|nr:TIGR03905 family TSCPD domain-containing protein [Kiritimatiellia bacterium]
MPTYRNTGTCSRSVTFELDADGTVTECSFDGGCTGNTVGVARLAVGRKAKDVIAALKGVPCRNGTSCPDQLARALEAELAKRAAS